MLVCKDLGLAHAALEMSFSFTAEAGQWIGIAGPSGSGKSTLLHLLVGFQTPQYGTLHDDDLNILTLAPHARGMNFMVQQSTLLPHFSCRKNLEIALHDFDGDKQARIAQALALACLPEYFLNRLPHELSGGELARMNLARTVLRPCRWILLDEPFAALDVDLRLKILSNLDRWHIEQRVGVMMISHEPSDAMLMADKLLFIERGRVIQAGIPADLASSPATSAMAKLLKTGSVFKHLGKTTFIAPHHLYTERHDAERSTQSATIALEHRCNNWRIVQIGAAQMIIDSDQEQFWLLPLDRKFSGSFYFLQKDLRYIE